jgi:hypothetical protein
MVVEERTENISPKIKMTEKKHFDLYLKKQAKLYFLIKIFETKHFKVDCKIALDRFSTKLESARCKEDIEKMDLKNAIQIKISIISNFFQMFCHLFKKMGR